MKLPAPEPGLVICYSYLWRREHRAGTDEGQKNRPCVIMLAEEKEGQAAPKVMVVPITHSHPAKDDVAIELPVAVRQYLGLDEERSWVILDEVNLFTWPGFDLQPMPGGEDRPDFGFLPPKLFSRLRAGLLAAFDARTVKPVSRD
jgi:hypothetical protein